MQFIGRQKELSFLNDAYGSNRPELILVTGRRRIGKTALLSQFAKDKPCLFFSCTQSGNREQLERLSRAVLANATPASRYLSRFDDWESAFEELAALPAAGKKLIILDEFPYLVEQNSAIPSILQNVWDRVLQYEDLMLVLCGSAVAFMEKELTGYKSPLYGRFTGRVRLRPLGCRDAFRFFPSWSLEERMVAYAMLGGTPMHLAMFDPSRTLRENV
ncbi:MAG: ATP-binding protein, partial [Duodenibacillus sp.]